MTVDASTKRQFSQRVASLREQQDLTQAELGRVVGVSGTCIWNWEGANTYPRPATLKRLAQALGTTPSFLSGRADGSGSDDQGARRPLAETIMEARQTVAAAAGMPVSKVRVVLDCGD
jgi:transcriptional regulator with XRE-family HTH domain